MVLIKKIILFILSMQEKLILKRLNAKKLSMKKTKRKIFSGKDCLLTLDSLADSEKKLMEDELEIILKSCNFNSEEILQYIKKHGTKIYYFKFSSFLKLLGLTEGFIYPLSGFKALCFSIVILKTVKFKTDAVFVLNNIDIDKYALIYQLYNWYSYQRGLEGIDMQAMNLLNKYLKNNNEDLIKKMSLDDMISLKEALVQDKSAIDFVLNLCSKLDSSKKALEKIKSDGANI